MAFKRSDSTMVRIYHSVIQYTRISQQIYVLKLQIYVPLLLKFSFVTIRCKLLGIIWYIAHLSQFHPGLTQFILNEPYLQGCRLSNGANFSCSLRVNQATRQTFTRCARSNKNWWPRKTSNSMKIELDWLHTERTGSFIQLKVNFPRSTKKVCVRPPMKTYDYFPRS